jgi:hypothetical protein
MPSQPRRSTSLAPIIVTFRYGFLGTGSFGWAYLAYGATFSALTFAKVESTFMNDV